MDKETQAYTWTADNHFYSSLSFSGGNVDIPKSIIKAQIEFLLIYMEEQFISVNIHCIGLSFCVNRRTVVLLTQRTHVKLVILNL